MIKNDYGKLNTPIYEEKQKSGLNVILIPKDSTLNTAILYIPQGFYLHDEEINNSKISFGCPFLLKEMILNDETKKRIEEEGCKVQAVCKHSYTYYKFESLSKLTASINILLNRIRNLQLSDDEVERYKKIIMSKSVYDDVLLAKDNVLKNLFINSPMKKGSEIKNSDLVKIHLTEMKKFLYKYYSIKSMTLFVSGNYTPTVVINDIRRLEFPLFPITSSKELKFNEDYSNVCEKRDVLYLDKTSNILSLGIKFLSRKELFEKYGELIFAFYEIVKNIIVENDKFKTMLRETDSKLLDFDIIEGYEDTSLIMTFSCVKFASLSNRLSDFLSTLEKSISLKFYNKIRKDYVNRAKNILANPSLLIDNFARLYADNLPYTYIVKKVSLLAKTDFIKILSGILSYPRSVTYLQQKEE